MKVFKIKDKEKIGIVLVYIDSEIAENEHVNLLKLRKNSDLAFVFSKSITKSISPKKMSYLYDASFYGISESDDKSLNLWEMLDYLDEFTEYSSYTVVNFLMNLKMEDFYINKLQNSVIEKSVFNFTPLNLPERRRLYQAVPRKRWKFLKYILPPVYDETGLYAKFSSLSYVFFLRPISIKQTKEFLAEEKEKTNTDVLSTFKGIEPEIFFPSIIPEDTVLCMDIDDVQINV